MAGGQAAPPAARTRVFFRFWDAAPVGPHESVRVLGSCTELGSWDLGSAVPLSRVEQCKGCWWTTHSVRIPLKQHFEYRYAIFHSETDDFIRWTKEGEEPLFAVATGRTLCLEDDNGRCRATGDDEAGQMSTVASRGASLAAEANSGSRPPSPSGYHGSQPTSPRSPASPRSGSCWNVRSKSMDLTQLCDVTSEDSAFLVFRSLPVVVKRAENGDWQVEKISHGAGTALPLLKHFTQTGVNKPPTGEAIDVSVKFIGHPGVCVRDDADRKQLTDLLAKHSCIPVFLDEDVVQKHNFFAEDYLWPVFHNMKIFDATITGDHEYESFDKALWKSFLNLNNAYAEVITTHGDENTLVWIHDYELVMVPRFVYHRNPDFTTGLFLHCAFPSTEVMSCLPVREDILQGMLSSRLVTFQTFDYLRHFMSCCSSVLGTRHSFQKGGILQVEHENRSVVVFADHFTVPYNHLIKKISDEKVVERAASIRNQFKGKTIIGAYDRFDCFSGLTLKLRTFHRFLQEYRSHRRSVVLVQYIRGRATDSKRKGMVSIEELRQMADATNKAFGVEGEPPLVTIVVEETTREKQLGVLLATDILLDTSTNDGLNLIPFNFYAAHSQDQKGVALISEFCGCSSVLTGAFKINPWNTGAVLTALDQAISITPEDQALRFTKDHSYVSSQTLVQWVHKNLSELKVTRNSRDLTYRASMAGPVHLPAEEVAAAYNAAKKRAIFLDNEGTIAAKQKWQIESTTMVALQKQGQPPDPYVVDLLQTLVNDRGNTVVVLSGRNKQVMEEWFGSVDGLGLFAEHGFHRLLPRTLREAQQQDGSERAWKSSAIADNNQEWKDLCIELMKQYVQRIQGSILEAKACAISWNYREVGATGVIDDVALELVRFLDPEVPTGLLHGYPVKVIMGKGYVEVKRADVDKGRAVIKTLEELGNVDFVLSIGDDRSDEDMFEAISDYFKRNGDGSAVLSANPSQSSLRRIGAGASSMASSLDGLAPSPSDSPNLSPKDKKAVRSVNFCDKGDGTTSAPSQSNLYRMSSSTCWFTATVGRKTTQAKHFCADVDEVTQLLKKLASKAIMGSFSRFASMPLIAPDSDQDDQEDSQDERPDVTAVGRATTHSSFLKKPLNKTDV